jgi:hypothetical protein
LQRLLQEAGLPRRGLKLDADRACDSHVHTLHHYPTKVNHCQGV